MILGQYILLILTIKIAKYSLQFRTAIAMVRLGECKWLGSVYDKRKWDRIPKYIIDFPIDVAQTLDEVHEANMKE